MSTPISELEQRALVSLLARDGPMAQILRAQLLGLRVSERRLSGAGFSSTFEAGEAAPVELDVSGRLGDVLGTSPEAPDGIGFVLFIERGCLKELEGYSFGNTWPPDESSIVIRPIEGASRDLTWLGQMDQIVLGKPGDLSSKQLT